MRVVLVGRAADRQRLRHGLPEGAVEIVGEAATMTGAAEAASGPVDAYLVAAREPPTDELHVRETLTPRELEVLRLLAEGLSNKAIAGRLGISDQTVKFHVASICGKLGALNRTGAVRMAIERGMIEV
jgi:DNA-binding NarL/FixJ family response regulator